MSYNADIAHCSGFLCPLAANCRRAQLFKAWNEMPKDARPMWVSFISQNYNRQTNSCEQYIKTMNKDEKM